MNLYIVRHATAVQQGTPGHEDDSQRPLTDAGRKRMKRIVKGLHELGIELNAVVTSPYVRARDTAMILAKEFGMKDKVSLSDSLIPPGNFENLINQIREKHDVENLALVGHEPMLSSLISWLTTGNTAMKVVLRKGGVACLSTENLYAEGRATLRWLLTPSLIVELSK